MNAAETRASSAIADWTPLTVVSRSPTTAEIETFINEVSTTSTNIAIARMKANRVLPVPSELTRADSELTGPVRLTRRSCRASVLVHDFNPISSLGHSGKQLRLCPVELLG